ncbi:MAG: CorA family divalent cation transporter, partial [bacterium]
MNNLIKGAKKKTYTSAGSLIFTGESSNEKAKISTFQLKQGKSSFIETVSLDEIKNSIKEDAQTWINVIGLHDVTTIRKIGEQFEIHPLILEDALNIHHLPKMEEYFKYIFFTMKSVSFHDKKDIKENHVTLLLGDQVIFSFQQYKDPVFDHVRERLTKRTIDSVGADFIFYVIIDFLTDSYYPVLEKIEEDMQKLEDSLIYNTGRDHIGSIIKKRKQLILLRKLLSSLEEEIKKLKKTDHILIDKK